MDPFVRLLCRTTTATLNTVCVVVVVDGVVVFVDCLLLFLAGRFVFFFFFPKTLTTKAGSSSCSRRRRSAFADAVVVVVVVVGVDFLVTRKSLSNLLQFCVDFLTGMTLLPGGFFILSLSLSLCFKLVNFYFSRSVTFCSALFFYVTNFFSTGFFVVVSKFAHRSRRWSLFFLPLPKWLLLRGAPNFLHFSGTWQNISAGKGRNFPPHEIRWNFVTFLKIFFVF